MPRAGTVHVSDPAAGEEHGQVWVFDEDGTRYDLTTEGTAGAQHINRKAIANAAYTVLETDHLVALTGATAPRTFTLPTAVGNAELVFIFKDETGNAATHNITVDGNASETIDGAATKVISANYGTFRIYSDGANWFTF
jgi:hypothetical protein